MTRYSRYIKFFNICGDILLLNICFIIAFYTKHQAFYHPFFSLTLYINLTWILLLAIIKPYKISRTSSYSSIATIIATLVGLHLLLVFAYYVIQQPYRYSREVLVLLYSTFLISLFVFKTSIFLAIKFARRVGFNYRNIIVITSNVNDISIVGYINQHPEYGYSIKAQINPETIDIENFNEKLDSLCKQFDVHEIFYSLSSLNNSLLEVLVSFADDSLLKVRLVADFKNITFNGIEVENYGTIPVIKVHATPLDEWDKQVIKRSFDVFFSFFVIVGLLSWLIPILALLIKLTSRGPVFFKQQRTGLNNIPFWCYKLRTMRPNKESDTHQALKNDKRITKIGNFLRKTSLDELPQFINVFLGHMSVVGPRPHMLKHTEDFSAEIKHFMQRHAIKPGITGLAQSKGFRGEISDYYSLSNRFKYDIYYLKNWNFLLDIQIIIRTFTQLMGNKRTS